MINTTEEAAIERKLTEIKQLKAQSSNSKEGSTRKEALVIAGETLTKVQDDSQLSEHFLEVTDRMHVVIACRVSPK